MIRGGWGVVVRRLVLGDEALDPRLLQLTLSEINEELRSPVSWPERVTVLGAFDTAYARPPESGVVRKGEMDLGWEEEVG